MSTQNKPDYKIFASGAKSGEIETFPDILRGWGVTIDRTGEIPPMEWFNAIGKRADEWLLYLTQRGVPEWDSSLDYPKTAIVVHGDNFYISKKANKGESPSVSSASWSKMSDFIGVPQVVQSTGTSTTQVMSQDGVTKTFVKIGDYGVGVPGSQIEVTDKKFNGFFNADKFSPSAPSDTFFGVSSYSPSKSYGLLIAGRKKEIIARTIESGVPSDYSFYHSGNATADKNGFLRTSQQTSLITSDIAQSTGSSTTKVMSQKAVTDELKNYPKMSAFDSLRSAKEAWYTLPNGIIRQSGIATLAPVGNFNMQELGGVVYYTHYYRVSFPRKFPNAQISTMATLASYIYTDQGSMAGKSISTHRDYDDDVSVVSKARFVVAYTTPNLGETPTIHFESIGY